MNITESFSQVFSFYKLALRGLKKKWSAAAALWVSDKAGTSGVQASITTSAHTAF